jgi:hypothetical protein
MRIMALLLAIGCAGSGDDPGPQPADLSDPATVVRLVNLGSTPNLFARSIEAFPDPTDTCLDVSGGFDEDALGTLAVTGGCTDANGRRWEGEAEATRNADGSATYTYASLSWSQELGCASGGVGRVTSTTNGELELRANGDLTARMTFEWIDESGDGCTPSDPGHSLFYEGHVDGDPFEGGATTWTGAGWVRANPLDRVEVATDAERLNPENCSSEALSGTTSLRDAGVRAVVTYDGATDCDPNGTVTWTLDGADQGTLTGVRR